MSEQEPEQDKLAAELMQANYDGNAAVWRVASEQTKDKYRERAQRLMDAGWGRGDRGRRAAGYAAGYEKGRSDLRDYLLGVVNAIKDQS